ncbi:hypothetical protein M3Y99_01777900 [Aphelenchoides fujianensis]|nr:hypothetical protein M3Y99_01777900 [Aphelenchoides fujianensis]
MSIPEWAYDEIKCFCDRLSCPGSLMCSGKWCLIGISTDGGAVRIDQICGWDERDRPMDCAKNWDRWAEATSPSATRSPTFRSNMDQQSALQAADSLHYSGEHKKYGSGSETKSKGWHQGGNVIILLVIIPLVVGGAAVCLVFINYHCKMS